MVLKNSLITITVWSTIGTDVNQLTQNHPIGLNLKNCTLTFRAISKLCTLRIITIDRRLRENISIDLWNSRKRAIPSPHHTRDQLISCGIRGSYQLKQEQLRVAEVLNVVKWIEVRPVSLIEHLATRCSEDLPYSKQSQLQMVFLIKYFSKRCMWNQKIWTAKQVKSQMIMAKSHSWEKKPRRKQKEEEEKDDQLFILSINNNETQIINDLIFILWRINKLD